MKPCDCKKQTERYECPRSVGKTHCPRHCLVCMKDDRLMDLAVSITYAWEMYTATFGQPPHGTVQQIAAMLELMPDKSFVRKEI